MKPLDTSNISPIQSKVEPHLRPLFPRGKHAIPLTFLYERAVKSFPKSQRRELVWKGLLNFLEELASWGITGEVWIDGSFCTHKLDPKDVDLILLIDRESVLSKTPSDRAKLKSWLTSREFLKKHYYCDVYYIDAGKMDRREYWDNWYGYCRDRVTPKGIVVLRIDHE